MAGFPYEPPSGDRDVASDLEQIEARLRRAQQALDEALAERQSALERLDQLHRARLGRDPELRDRT